MNEICDDEALSREREAARRTHGLQRKRAIAQALEPILTKRQMGHAIRLCDQEFPVDEPFSTTAFCQRLMDTLPGVELGYQTYVALLKAMRGCTQAMGGNGLASTPQDRRDPVRTSPQPPLVHPPAAPEPPEPPEPLEGWGFDEVNEEAKRREGVIRQTLQPILSEEQVEQAIRLCQREFPPDAPFSTSYFCQRLLETLPGVALTPHARLGLLRDLRHTAGEHQVNRHTQVITLPAALQAEPPEVAPPSALPQAPSGTANGAGAGPHSGPDPTNTLQARIDTMIEQVQRDREQRLHRRRRVTLPGQYWTELSDTPTGQIRLTELSLGGARFETLSPHLLKKQQTLTIEFSLDNEPGTPILQNVDVQWLEDRVVGVAWLDQKAMQKVLGAYLSQ